MNKYSIINNYELCFTQPESEYKKFYFLIIINYTTFHLKLYIKNFNS